MRKVFILEISGVGTDRPVRYYSGTIAPPSKTDARSGHVYRDVPGLRGPEEVSVQLDPRGGVAVAESIVMSVATGRRSMRGSTDAGILLTRRGPKAASAFALLLESIPNTDPGAAAIDIFIDRDPAVFGATPHVIHIGREAFRVDSTGGAGSGGDPYYLRCERAVWGTQSSAHVVQARSSRRPFVLSQCVSWRSRRAIIYEAEILSGIKWGAIVELRRGFLEHAPRSRGNSIEIEIAPLSAALNMKIGSELVEARLASGVHYFDGSNRISIGFALGFEQGGAWTAGFNHNPSAADGGVIEVNSTDGHADTMDITLLDVHPRHGDIVTRGREYTPTAYQSVPSIGFAIDEGPIAINDFDAIDSAATNELHIVDLVPPGAEKLASWPSAIWEAFADIRTDEHTGLSGMWAQVMMNIWGPDGPVLNILSNVPSAGPLWLTTWTFDHWPGGSFGKAPLGAYGGRLRGAPSEQRMMLNAVDLADPGDARYPIYPLSQGASPRRQSRWSRRVRIDHRDAGTNVPIRGICARGFYEAGEWYITSDTDVPVASGVVTLEITYSTRDGDGEQKTYAEIVSSTEVGVGVYALRLTERSRRSLPSFGDWHDTEPVVMRPTIQIQRTRAFEVILRLLQSSGGGQVNGTFDLEAYGAGIHEDDIDVRSMTAHPWKLDRWGPTVEAGAIVREAIDPMLQLEGASIVDAVVDGRSVLRLISLGETGAPATSVLDGKDFNIAEVPEEITEQDVVNVLVIKANHAQSGAGDAERTLTFQDSGSIDFYGDAEAMEIDARGLQLRSQGDAVSSLRDASAGAFYRLAYAPKAWRASTTTKAGDRLQIGEIVEVTNLQLKSNSDRFGVKAIRARVMGLTVLKGSVGSEVELRQLAVEIQYWGASATVTAIINDFTVEVSLNVDSEDADPATGAALQDVDGFAAADKVDILAPYNHDAFEEKVISSITGRQITFTAEHETAIGAILLPVSYSDATAKQREGSHLANSSGRRGGLPGDPGIELLE